MELYKTFDHEWGHSLGSTFRNISIPSLFGYSYQFLKRDIYLKNTMDNIFLQLSIGQIFWQLVGNDKRMTGKYEMKETYPLWSVQFSSVAQSCLTLCDSMDCSTPGFLVHYQLPELAQTHVHRVGDAIQPSYPLSSASPPAFNLSQHQGLFQWVSSSHQVAKVLEFQLQHQPFQWIFRTDFL